MVTLAADDILVHAQFLELLLVEDAPPVSAVAKLPEPEVAATLGSTFPWGSVLSEAGAITMIPAMLAHERAGNPEGALACVAIILEAAVADGGTECTRTHAFAHTCRRCPLATYRLYAARDSIYPIPIIARNSDP